MIDALFSGLGALFATGAGVLLLSGLAGLLLILWNWRFTLVALPLLHLGVNAQMVLLHGLDPLLAAGQMVAILICTGILAASSWEQRASPTLRPSGNLFLRIGATGLLLVAWWAVDPGVIFPIFGRVETDLLMWFGLVGLLVMGLSHSPFYWGVALLLWIAPIHAIAGVLLAGSGLAPIVGIAAITMTLASSYLMLSEPVATRLVGAAATESPVSELAATVSSDLQTPSSRPGGAPPTSSRPALRQRILGRTRPQDPVAK